MDIIFRLEQIREAASGFMEATRLQKIFVFTGEMGSGKTTFIKECAMHKGVVENVSSPTFSIINEYRCGNDEIIYHMDLYRLKDEEEARNAGVEEAIYSGRLCFIEWPERAPDLIPDNAVTVLMEVLAADTRKLSFTAPE
jgi:tRNA threonylcarbamoyladenosine biosynthesis protein TsaE